jgi:hypothetical protein
VAGSNRVLIGGLTSNDQVPVHPADSSLGAGFRKRQAAGED